MTLSNCFTPARAAAVLLFLGLTAGTFASTAHAQSQPLNGVVALMLADGRPHFFLNGKEIDLAAATAPIPAPRHRAAAHLQTVAEVLPPSSPAADRDADRAAERTAEQEQSSEHATFAFAGSHSPSIEHTTLPATSSSADGTTEVTTIRVCMGQSMQLIRSSMGQPDRILAQGAKTIFVYDGIKVTFTDGKVSSVD